MSKNRISEKLSTEPYKGVRDFYPEDQQFLTYLFSTIRGVVERAGYVEYHASVLEPAELYTSKGADNAEIINEQSYTFVDRGGRQVALRPEMTPTVARMVAARRRELAFPLRLYSLPNLFRYERPQRGRLREHWQLNVDLFGSRSPLADAEIIMVAYELMRAFGASESDFVVKVGSRAYIDHVAQENALSEEQTKKLLGLLDKKQKISEHDFSAGLRELGVSESVLSPENPPPEVVELLKYFGDAGVGTVVYDPSVVRGFAYYTGMVFEVFDTHPDNTRALFGGGRYDNLTALFEDASPEGGVPGVGFGMGDVTIRDFLAVRGLLQPYVPPTAVYIAVTSPDLAVEAQALAGTLRREGVNVAVDFGEKKLGDQIKTAAKHKIPRLIVVGENELATGVFSIKNLETGAEEQVPQEELSRYFNTL